LRWFWAELRRHRQDERIPDVASVPYSSEEM
jgi:hypothetical protein